MATTDRSSNAGDITPNVSLGAEESIRRKEWIAEKISRAMIELSDKVSTNPQILGGSPVLAGTRMPLSRIFAEISDGLTIAEISKDFDLNEEDLKAFFNALSVYFEQAFVHDRRIPAR